MAQTNTERTKALISKADCYVRLRDLDEARKTMMRVNHFGLSDSLSERVRYQTALYSYLCQEFEQCNSQLLQLEQHSSERTNNEYLLLYALSLNETREWTMAREKLNTWLKNAPLDSIRHDSIWDAADRFYKLSKQPRYVDPERAKFFSSIVPGTGQLYAGYLFESAFSATMVLVGVGAAAYGVLILKYYVTGLMTGFVISQQFYTSGIRRADFLAQKRNFKAARKYNDKLKNFILDLGSPL
ncbi:MAG: hypothetical protein R2813_14040 [Flavobacteriales bacterium]